MDYDELVEGITDALLEATPESKAAAAAYWAGRKERAAKRKADGFPAPMTRKQQDERRSREIDAHFARGGPHDRGECGPVCTAFDW